MRIDGAMRQARAVSIAGCGIMAFAASGALANPVGHDQKLSLYAGQEGHPVAGLTVEEIEQLLAGEGSGFARPAELNGYPGPRHVLELAKPLQLSAGQQKAVQPIFDRMKANAGKLGAQLVEAERRLSELFRTHVAVPPSVAARSAAAERLRAELRMVHLAAHLEVTEVPSGDQRRRYSELRGHAAVPAHGMHK
jgi:hypothetical protein